MAILVAHAWYYRHFMADDAFISLRYSDRLLRGLGLTWSDGEVVEGYSNLLWVLGCALLGKLRIDLVVAARALGFIGSAAAIAALLWVHRGPTIQKALPGLAGGLAMALSGPVVIWTVGGLEQPLLAGLLAWALAFSFPVLEDPRPRTASLLVPGLLFGLIVITRADGVVFTVAACLGILAARGLNRATLRAAFLLALLPFLFFVGQLAFRLAYYHDWLPNSAYAKVGLTPERVWTGLQYVGGGIYLAGLLVPSLFVFRVAASAGLRSRILFLAAILAFWLAYVATVGGDLFPGHRHLVPAIVVLSYLTAIVLTKRISSQGPLGPVLWTGAFCALALVVFQFLDPQNMRARNERWEWDGKVIGGLLAKAFGAQHPLLAVDPAGCVPYFSGLPSVDMLGINDRYLAHHRPADFGKGSLGHELGSGAYVLSRKPDLVLFARPTGSLRPYFRSGREMVSDPRSEFDRRFRPVTFECERPWHLLSIIWVRTEGGAIGIRRSKDRIQIPGYLFAANRLSKARLDAAGRIGVGVFPDTPAGLTGLMVPAGTWRVLVEGSGGGVFLHVWRTATTDILAIGGSGFSFEIGEGEPATLSISIETRENGGAHVREIVLERVGPMRA
ncbi:MAG: hypothetical protein E6K76_10095 [Candidatus Eisenbacteria bacterium]|uniref:Glycosyltransferase RgtA/B/C/D-like domain-containing protein n=1 Tax=Eiseniibacteriota bacterium TaxID=2212470 RepID=A0A538T229_UNCEI|nr:MAG: hypothetical protein E6K76_10095 [Candidatus Eisenbacteria bacterium]